MNQKPICCYVRYIWRIHKIYLCYAIIVETYVYKFFLDATNHVQHLLLIWYVDYLYTRSAINVNNKKFIDTMNVTMKKLQLINFINLTSIWLAVMLNLNSISTTYSEYKKFYPFSIFFFFFSLITKTHSTLHNQCKRYIMDLHSLGAITTYDQIVLKHNNNKDRSEITHVCAPTLVHTRCAIIL